eukprot:2677025-Rhodomonas_salina.1
MSGTVRRDAHEHPTSSFVCSACDMPVPPDSLGRSYLNTGTTTGGNGHSWCALLVQASGLLASASSYSQYPGTTGGRCVSLPAVRRVKSA